MGVSSSDNWVTPLRGTPSTLKPIYTTHCGGGDSESGPTTPTSEGSRIPLKLPCPPPPRKRKPAPAAKNVRVCKNSGSTNNSKLKYTGKREFFIAPPDLEAVFIRRHNNVGC